MVAITTPSNIPIVNLPNLYVNGFELSWGSNTTLSMALGQCRDSSNTVDINMTAAVTINAAVVGANGIDTGALAASKVYYVFVVDDSSGTNSAAGLISLSRTAPILPSGYDSARRVGAWTTDGSVHFYLMYQEGSQARRTQTYDAPVSAGSAVTSSTYASIDLTNKVPFIDKITSILQVVHTPGGTGVASGAILAPGASTSTTYYALSGQVSGVVTQDNWVPMPLAVVTTTIVFQAKVGSVGSNSLALLAKGWIDNL